MQLNDLVLSSHIIEIQQKLSERALELLALPDEQPCFILDIGCGSGLSGEILSDNGHYWVGVDISRSMLGNYKRLFPLIQVVHI
jgi:18S rRNA (guanine1575-N7)-methyltransferase